MRVPGGHVMQSSVWAAYRAERGWEPRFLTFDDGQVALALLRRSPALPGVEAVVRRGPAHRGEAAEIGAAWAVGLSEWAAAVGARDLFLDPERPRDAAYEAAMDEAGFVAERWPRALDPRHASRAPARDRRGEPRCGPLEGDAPAHPRRRAGRHDRAAGPGRRAAGGARRAHARACRASWASRCSRATTTWRVGGRSWAPVLPASWSPSTRAPSWAACSSIATAASTRPPTRPTTPPSARSCRARCTSFAGRPSARPSATVPRPSSSAGVDLPGHREPPRPGEPGRGLYEHKRGFGAVWVERAAPRRIVLRPGAERLARGRRLLIDAARRMRR